MKCRKHIMAQIVIVAVFLCAGVGVVSAETLFLDDFEGEGVGSGAA